MIEKLYCVASYIKERQQQYYILYCSRNLPQKSTEKKRRRDRAFAEKSCSYKKDTRVLRIYVCIIILLFTELFGVLEYSVLLSTTIYS